MRVKGLRILMTAAAFGLVWGGGASATMFTPASIDGVTGGSAAYDSLSGDYTLSENGGGTDGNLSTEFDYVALTGNFTVSAEITSWSNKSFGVAGLMVMQPTLNTSGVVFNSGNQLGDDWAFANYHAPYSSSWSSTQAMTGTNPMWFKLVRSSNTVTSYASRDGVTWTGLMQASNVTSSSLDVGLFVGSSAQPYAASATFGNLSGFGVSPPLQTGTGGAGSSPVPEPAALSLLALACLGVGLRRKRQVRLA